MKNTWGNEILKRLGNREDVGKLGLYDRYFRGKGLPPDSVLECLDLLEDELTIPPGVLRPDDSLDLLFEPVSSRNPFRWMEYQVRAGDVQGAISGALSDRLREFGTFEDWVTIATVDDLIRAWCGEKPTSPEQELPSR
jgi:hypothetical protein